MLSPLAQRYEQFVQSAYAGVTHLAETDLLGFGGHSADRVGVAESLVRW